MSPPCAPKAKNVKTQIPTPPGSWINENRGLRTGRAVYSWRDLLNGSPWHCRTSSRREEPGSSPIMAPLGQKPNRSDKLHTSPRTTPTRSRACHIAPRHWKQMTSPASAVLDTSLSDTPVRDNVRYNAPQPWKGTLPYKTAPGYSPGRHTPIPLRWADGMCPFLPCVSSA